MEYAGVVARIARGVALGVPHHITQRGNRRQQASFCDGDREAHLDEMAQRCARWAARQDGLAARHWRGRWPRARTTEWRSRAAHVTAPIIPRNAARAAAETGQGPSGAGRRGWCRIPSPRTPAARAEHHDVDCWWGGRGRRAGGVDPCPCSRRGHTQAPRGDRGASSQRSPCREGQGTLAWEDASPVATPTVAPPPAGTGASAAGQSRP